jgi:hypothetical protein
MKRGPHMLLFAAMVPLCWLLMMLVHELGHVLGAWLTGGEVQQVVWHPLVISRTDVSPNPLPLFVVWAGPVFGALFPVALWSCLHRFRRSFLLKFFAGFCLIANGAYIGYGSFERIGDCREMLIYGTPIWLLWLWGAVHFAAGLLLWNGLGPQFGWGKRPEPVSWRLAGTVAVLSLLVIVCGFLIGTR